MVHQYIKVFLPLFLQDVLVEECKRYSQHSKWNLALHDNSYQIQQPEQSRFHIIFKLLLLFQVSKQQLDVPNTSQIPQSLKIDLQKQAANLFVDRMGD